MVHNPLHWLDLLFLTKESSIFHHSVHFNAALLLDPFRGVCIVSFVYALDTSSLILSSNMAVPANPRTGDREDDLWMQPASGVLDPEDDITMFTHPYTMQADNVSWNPEDYINWSNDVPANISMIQPACERDGTAQSSSNHINTLAANGSDSGGYVNKTPRGGGAEEQMQALFTTTFPTDSDIEPQYLPGNTILAEKDQEEPEYITYARTPHVAKRARGNSGPSSQEWQKWKREIYNLYVSNTLEVTREEMAKKGFHAGSVTLFFFSLRILC